MNSAPTATSRADAARINGALSQGPVTAEGKARSSQNSLKFGLYAATIVLSTESQQDYDALHLSYTELFTPTDIFEHQTVTTMVNAQWQLRRIQSIRTCQFNLAIDHIRSQRPGATECVIDVLHTIAFNALCANKEAIQASRESDRLQRLIDRQYTKLLKHRSTKAPRGAKAPVLSSEPSAAQNPENEPKPTLSDPPPPPILSQNLENEPKPDPQQRQIPRGALCPCRSGRKFKHCCGKNAPPVLSRAA